jgi:hypothetical protein
VLFAFWCYLMLALMLGRGSSHQRGKGVVMDLIFDLVPADCLR